jgi:hypothetical protein
VYLGSNHLQSFLLFCSEEVAVEMGEAIFGNLNALLHRRVASEARALCLRLGEAGVRI